MSDFQRRDIRAGIDALLCVRALCPEFEPVRVRWLSIAESVIDRLSVELDKANGTEKGLEELALLFFARANLATAYKQVVGSTAHGGEPMTPTA